MSVRPSRKARCKSVLATWFVGNGIHSSVASAEDTNRFGPPIQLRMVVVIGIICVSRIATSTNGSVGLLFQSLSRRAAFRPSLPTFTISPRRAVFNYIAPAPSCDAEMTVLAPGVLRTLSFIGGLCASWLRSTGSPWANRLIHGCSLGCARCVGASMTVGA